MSYFPNRNTLGDWVVYCDLCGCPCKASDSGMKSAGIDDQSLLLCKKRCYDKYNVNPQHIYPTPVVNDPQPAPIVRTGFDEDYWDDVIPVYTPPGSD